MRELWPFPYLYEDIFSQCNSTAFKPGEVDFYRANDAQIADCQKRRKAAILKASKIVGG